MDTKPEDRSDTSCGSSDVAAAASTDATPSSDKNGSASKTDTGPLWQTGTKALNRTWEDWRTSWSKLASWARAAAGSTTKTRKPD